jgi:hypothetical protein
MNGNREKAFMLYSYVTKEGEEGKKSAEGEAESESAKRRDQN